MNRRHLIPTNAIRSQISQVENDGVKLEANTTITVFIRKYRIMRSTMKGLRDTVVCTGDGGGWAM